MKFAINTATHFGSAIVSLLEDAGYDYAANAGYADGTDNYVLVNTSKKTFKDSDNDGGRPVYDPTTQWAAIAALAANSANTGGTQDTAATPTIPTVTANGLRVGDQVTATNGSKTKAKFRLQAGFVYTVDRLTAKGNVGLAGLPNDEYLAKRFTKAVSAIPGSQTATTVAAIDVAGNTLAVGDTVLTKVANPGRRDGKFALPANGVQTITEITAKGKIGFGGADQYNPARFQKVTLSDAAGNVNSGDLVVNTVTRRDGRFALPLNTALTFRGLTVEGGKFILDGYTTDQYAPSRFQKVTFITA